MNTSCSKFTVLLAVLPVSITGCLHQQLRYNTVKQATTVADVHESQVLDNLAKFADNPNSLPHFSLPNAGASGVSGDLGASAGFEFNPFKWLFGVSGTRAATESYTLTPINDPRKLELMRCAYQRAVSSCCSYGEPGVCPNCNKRFNKFYLGSEKPAKVAKVTEQGYRVYRVKQNVRVGYKDTGNNCILLPSQIEVYATTNDLKLTQFHLLTEIQGVPPGTKVSHVDRDSECKDLEPELHLDQVFEDNSVFRYTIDTGEVTSDCLHSPCWFHVGAKADAPKRCDCKYVGRHCDTYVWVDDCYRNELTKLTMVILDIALNDPPTARSKEVVAYLSPFGEIAKKGDAAYKITAQIPFGSSHDTVVKSKPRVSLNDLEPFLTIGEMNDVTDFKDRVQGKSEDIGTLVETPTDPTLSSLKSLREVAQIILKGSTAFEQGTNKATTAAALKQEKELYISASKFIAAIHSARRRVREKVDRALESRVQLERQSIEFLAPTQTPIPGAGYLQFQQNLDTLAPAR